MCGCGINEPCYGCPCGCYHNPKYLAEHERYSKSRRAISRVRELAEKLAETDWRGHPPVEHQISQKLLKLLDGEK